MPLPLSAIAASDRSVAGCAPIIVERDPNDPNRINVLLPPDLVNQLRIFAMLVEFRLQYSGSALSPGIAAAALTAGATSNALAAGATPLSFAV